MERRIYGCNVSDHRLDVKNGSTSRAPVVFISLYPLDEEMNVSEALVRAILELIEKCETMEELRESVKRIIGE